MNPFLRVKKTKNKGRGIFTTAAIKEGEVIELAPTLAIPKAQIKDNELLITYIFEEKKHYYLVLGYGSLYNHSYSPNAYYILRPKKGIMEYIALQDIKANSEITINYNGDPDDGSPLWFHSK